VLIESSNCINLVLNKLNPLHDMPKRGRPARVSKALQIDNEKPSTIKSKQLKRKHDSTQPTTSKRAMN
jgi:hypothetical protein